MLPDFVIDYVHDTWRHIVSLSLLFDNFKMFSIAKIFNYERIMSAVIYMKCLVIIRVVYCVHQREMLVCF